MQFRISLITTALTFALVSCDNGNQLSTNAGGNEVVAELIETIDFFGMEQSNSETIPYEPELGFALPARGTLSLNTAVIGSTTQEYLLDVPRLMLTVRG